MGGGSKLWVLIVAVLIFGALVVEGLTIKKIGVGPLSVELHRRNSTVAGTPAGESGLVPISPAVTTTAPAPVVTTSQPAAVPAQVEVPGLAGKDKQTAGQLLATAGLKAEFVSVDSDAPVDQVVGTAPASGAKVDPGATVQVKVSRGPFVGTWVNSDPNTRSVPQVTLEPASSTTVTLHVWGACSPSWCDWGTTTASLANGELRATYTQSFAVKTVRLYRSGAQLVVLIHTHFTDNSGRADYDSTNAMNKK
jgi:hypothetical protein